MPYSGGFADSKHKFRHGKEMTGLLEQPMPFQASFPSSLSRTPAGSNKQWKKPSKEEADKQKHVEKKRRRLEKALANSAAIRLELEKKKQKKKEEEMRLDEESAALAEAVALFVLLDDDAERMSRFQAYDAGMQLQSYNLLSGTEDGIMDASYLCAQGPFECIIPADPGFTLYDVKYNVQGFECTERIREAHRWKRQVLVHGNSEPRSSASPTDRRM